MQISRKGKQWTVTVYRGVRTGDESLTARREKDFKRQISGILIAVHIFGFKIF